MSPNGELRVSIARIWPRFKRRKFPVRKTKRLSIIVEQNRSRRRLRVRHNPIDDSRNARFRAEMFKSPAAKTPRARCFRSRPQIATRRFKQTDKTIIDDSRRIAFVENLKPHAVKPRQARRASPATDNRLLFEQSRKPNSAATRRPPSTGQFDTAPAPPPRTNKSRDTLTVYPMNSSQILQCRRKIEFRTKFSPVPKRLTSLCSK